MQNCFINADTNEYCCLKNNGKYLKWYTGKIGEKKSACKVYSSEDYSYIEEALLDAGFVRTARSVADLTIGVNVYKKTNEEETLEIESLIKELKRLSKKKYQDTQTRLTTGIETIKNAIEVLEIIQDILGDENNDYENYIDEISWYITEIAQIFPEMSHLANNITYDNLREKGEEMKHLIDKKLQEEIARYHEWKITKNHLYSMGVTIKPADAKLKREVKAKIGGSYNFNCWYVVNSDTELLYNKNVEEHIGGNHEKEELLWHGSADVNWERILLEGLKIRPAGVETKDEGWFGQGIYFSKNFSVARWYSERKSKEKKCYVALFKVRIGNCHEVILENESRQKQSNLGKEYLESNNLDSVHVSLKMGKNLVDRELAIFDPQQATIYALVEVLR